MESENAEEEGKEFRRILDQLAEMKDEIGKLRVLLVKARGQQTLFR